MDGMNGKGNRYGISIEICYSKSGGEKFTKSEENGAELVAMLLKKYGWGIDKVTKHQDYSGKYCPHRTLDLGWERFLNLVREKMGESPKPQPTPEPKPSGLKHKEGEVVKINGIYASSTSEDMLKPAISQGTITKVFEGTRNPYLLNSGDGFVNDNCIVDNTPTPTPTPTPEPEPKPSTHTYKYAIGDVVTINGVYKSSNAKTKLKPAVTKGEITAIYKGTANPYLLNNGDIGFVNDSCIVENKPTPAPTPKPSGLKHSVGEVVRINGIYSTANSTNKLKPAISQGKITKIYEGTNNPYLLNNGDGFVNDNCII